MKRTYTHAHQTCRRTARSRYVRKISDVQDYKGNVRSLMGNSWFERVRLAGIKRKVEFKLDTGAQVNVLPLNVIKHSNVKIESSKLTLKTYTNARIPVVGKVEITCQTNNTERKVEFQVVDMENICPILGLKSVVDFGLIVRKINSINNTTMYHDYKDLFKGIGSIKTKPCNITLKENAIPRVAACRKIPFKLQQLVKDELDRMEKLKLIEKVTVPTDWVHPIVVVSKKGGKIRICIDPMQLNNAIKREHYKLPTFEELTADLINASIFSTLDANCGFHQINLNEKSSYLTTFITPFGRYRFKRLPFGISNAPEIFHATFSTIFGDIQGVKIYIDDILIFAKTQVEHDKILKNVFDRAREYGVTFNKDKCIMGKTEVKYMGHILSGDGIKLDPDRAKAIAEIPVPKNRDDLNRFLGMVTYVSRFIPNIANLTINLRNLKKSNVEWNWSEYCNREFCTLKRVLSEAPVLRFFDVNKPIVLSVDSSREGLGAVILQEGCPIMYASKTLSVEQQRYAQIEKETLAILHGCERFRQFLFGQKVIVETDHKPLETIFKKPLDKVPLRLQRFRLQLQRYDIDVIYKPGKQLYIADTLSRASFDDKSFELKDDSETQVNLITEIHDNLTDSHLTEIKNKTTNDPELRLLRETIKRGWPAQIKNVPELIRQYWPVRSELTLNKEIIVKGTQIVIPRDLRANMIEKAHYNHMGVERSISRATECIYWPMMVKQIRDKVESCYICLANSRSNQKETLINREIPQRPWQIIAMDLFQLDNIFFFTYCRHVFKISGSY